MTEIHGSETIWFLAYEQGKLTKQGRIIERLEGTYVLVQFYSWADGELSYGGVVTLEEIRYWKLFGSHEDMQECYKNGKEIKI